MDQFLSKNGLDCVLAEINKQSITDKQLIIDNFSFIQEEEGATELLQELLIFLRDHSCASFDLILACFRVENFERIIQHFEVLRVRNLISNDNLMLVLNKEECNGFAYSMDMLNEILSQKSLDLLRNSSLIGIKQQISEMLDLVGLNDNYSLLKVWEYEKPLTFLKALELFSEDDDIQLETVFKIAECLELERLQKSMKKVYHHLNIHVITEIALADIDVNEKRERLSNYCKSLRQNNTSYRASAGIFPIAGVPRNAPPVQEEASSLGMR